MPLSSGSMNWDLCLLGLTKERVKMHHVSLLGSGVVSDP